MAKYKNYNYDQTLFIPVNLKEQLQPGTLEWAINFIIECMVDISIFDTRYKNDDTGRTAYNPKILLKIVLLGYARGILYSRELERACRENIIFMALTCNQTPDHSTIATFISTMQKEILLLFQQVLLICDQSGLLGGTVFAVDGCRISSNASKEWSGTFKELERKKERLEKQLKRMLKKHQLNDSLVKQEVKKAQHEKIKKLKKDIDKIDRFLKESSPKIGRKGNENKSNLTDNDSVLMQTTKGVIQGYNAQAIVDSKHQVIMHSDPGTNVRDDEHLQPLVNGARENLKAIDSSIKLENYDGNGDSSYHSQTNMVFAFEEGLKIIIPDNDFRNKDHRYNRKNKFTSIDFEYDATEDYYLCPDNKRLNRAGTTRRGGNQYRNYAASPNDCKQCKYRNQCLKNDKTKRRHLQVFFDPEVTAYARTIQEKLATDEGRALYDQRIGIVEPVFANMTYIKRMNRFNLRSKTKVGIQWMLFCMVHNIEKILHYGDMTALSPT